MKRVVSVSLGSSKRDKKSVVSFLGEMIEISRIGTDGDIKEFANLVKKLDGSVNCIGLGGIDRYLWTDKKRYTIRQADKIARLAKVTPVVDGSGVKNTLERKTIEYLQKHKIVDFKNKNVLLVCGVDRFGMAQAFDKYAGDVIYGDLMFNLGINIPIRSYASLRRVASIFLPIICLLPFKWIYPTGSKQEEIIPKYGWAYEWADVVAGDFHLIRRTMPTAESGLLRGKIIISNTITEADMRLLKERGVSMLVTATPEVDGRYYPTNVFEGVLVTLLNKSPEYITVEDYEYILKEIAWTPTITHIDANGSSERVVPSI